MQRFKIFILLVVILILFNMCGKTKSCCVINLPPVTFTSERTSLEKQILGSYKEIRRDVWLVSSAQTVSGISTSISSNTNVLNSDIQLSRKVISAVQTIEYDKDEINKLKMKKIIGEGRDGFIHYLGSPDVENNPAEKEKIINIINEVNDARLILMLEVINKNDNLTINDLEKIKETFGEMNINNAKPGEMIETENSEWKVKE